ncbi:MAG: S16 family serine protease [Nitrospirales bacterium]
MCSRIRQNGIDRPGIWAALGAALVLLLSVAVPASAKPYQSGGQWREQLIHILGTTMDQSHETKGIVGEIVVGLQQRQDHHGMEVTFEYAPGDFSLSSQAAVLTAIDRTARVAHLNTDSWSVVLTVPQPITVHGDSLSAMVGLTVVALAKGDFIFPDRVITGTVTPDGHIGTVGSLPLKVDAAHKERLRRVLVPEELDVADSDWDTPFLMQISPVDTVDKAYQALTGRPLDESASAEDKHSETAIRLRE